MHIDLLLKGGRLIDPASGIDAQRDVAIADGRIAAMDADIPAERAVRVIDASGCIVAPGVVDLHSHV